MVRLQIVEFATSLFVLFPNFARRLVVCTLFFELKMSKKGIFFDNLPNKL